MPGLDLRRHLDELARDPDLRSIIPVLFSASLDLAEIAEPLGIYYVEKPFHPRELVAAIRDAIEARIRSAEA